MEVLHRRCAGLDVHSEMVVACVRLAARGKVQRETRHFAATTSALLELADWLEYHRCTHVAMEATGVYWKPVWHILAERFDIVLANAMHVRNVPGRKSDMSDAEWIADLLAHGLVRASFVPPPLTQELRDLTRTRKQLVREMARHTQRIQKTLEDANVKLVKVVADVLGMSGRRVLNAIADGESDPEKLADLTGRLKASRAEIVEALRGRITSHHRYLVRLHLEQIASLERAITDLERRVESLLEPFRDQQRRLMTIPGVSTLVSQVILAEVGTDMSRFPTAGHLVSWAGLCPRLAESAGKILSRRIRKGSPWLKATLVQAAWSASRKKDSYLRAQYYRLRSRRGGKKAQVAVAASILVAVYHILKNGEDYADLGGQHFDHRDKQRLAAKLVRRLHDLGLKVTIEPAA